MATCRKQKAIEEEDYDTAKAIKGQIADLRAGGARKTLDEVVIRVDATAHGSSQMSPDTPVTLPGEHPTPGIFSKEREQSPGLGTLLCIPDNDCHFFSVRALSSSRRMCV